MNFIGNYKNWIQQSWIDELLGTEGYARFKEGQQPDSPSMQEQYDKAIKAGYDPNKAYFYMFDKTNVSFKIDPPWLEGKKYHWWITKMLPGNCMPIHVDPHTIYEQDSNRYWMPLQDYTGGHFFVYKDVVFTEYKQGDVFVYDDSQASHGAANVSITPRLVLQVSTYT